MMSGFGKGVNDEGFAKSVFLGAGLPASMGLQLVDRLLSISDSYCCSHFLVRIELFETDYCKKLDESFLDF